MNGHLLETAESLGLNVAPPRVSGQVGRGKAEQIVSHEDLEASDVTCKERSCPGTHKAKE